MIKKIRPQTRPQSSCHHSLGWIAQYAKETLIQRGVAVQYLWVIDDNQQCFDHGLPTDAIVDILLTGSFFLRMLELPYWPVKNIRLWTLSEDIKNLLVEVFKLAPESIGIIPHPPLPEIKTSCELNHFIYAGRLSWGKNIEALLSLTSYLQQTTHPHLTLTLYGEKSDLPEESFGRITDDDFDIHQLIQIYPWKNTPVIKGNNPQWFKELPAGAHYISLSTSMYEDFALSPTEAACNQTSLVLSCWGGHKHKKGAKLLSSNLIFKSFEPSWVKDCKTKLLAKELLTAQLVTGQDLAFYGPQVTDHHQLQKLSLDFIHKQSPEILLCFREATDVYADTFKGRNFFYLYQKHFSSLSVPHEMVIYQEEAQPLNLGPSPLFIAAHDSHLPEVMKMKMRAKIVYES